MHNFLHTHTYYYKRCTATIKTVEMDVKSLKTKCLQATTGIALRRVVYSSPYCFAKTASKVRWSKDDSFLQGCCRFYCRLVDLSVDGEHDVEPRSIVSSHASVLNFTLEVEVREAGVSHESDVVYEFRFGTERRRRWYAGVQRYMYKQRQDGGRLRCAVVQNVWHWQSTMAS